MTALLALLPILLLLALMAGLRWSAASAGLASAAAATAVAMLGFGYGAEAPAPALIGPLAEAAFTALAIVWIVFGALAIHEYQTRSGAVAVFGEWLDRGGGDKRTSAIFVAWFFALFLEGAAGFGTPIALAAPLLVGLGVTPVKALTSVLIGHAAGVSFGAVGTPILPLLAAAPVDPAMLSLAIVLLHAAFGWALAALVLRIAGGGKGGWRLVAGASAAFFLPAALLAWATGPELPTLGGAILGALAFGWFARRGQRGDLSAARIAGAALPYLLVIALILLTRLPPPVREGLAGLSLGWRWEGYGGSIAPLLHPGTLLVLAFLGTALARRGGLTLAARSAAGAAARLPKVALALVSVLLVARLMIHSGMIGALAEAAAVSLGPAWPLAAPMVGAAGSFITGSATASNILFADLQAATAEAAGMAPVAALAAQGFGSAIGNIIAPHNIVAGAATVGLVGAEGKVLKRTLPVCLLYAAAGGLILFAWSLA